MAFSVRRDSTNKDWEDLLLLKPTPEELDAAIEFIKLTNSPPKNSSKKIKTEFKETLNDLRQLYK